MSLAKRGPEDNGAVEVLKRRRRGREHEDGQESSSLATLTALSHHDYTVGWICALPLEMSAAKAMLDVVHPALSNLANDQNTYTLGKKGVHNVVMACMSSGVYGMTSATRVASQMRSSFPSIRFGLMVGIGGGAPHAHADVRLGDVVVSKPTERFGGVVQYDYGKTVQEGGLNRIGTLNKPPEVLLTAISSLQADHNMRPGRIPEYLSDMIVRHPMMASEFACPPQQPDRLFEVHYEHVELESTCDLCDSKRLVHRAPRAGNHPVIHYGLIATANQVMKHAATRDKLAGELGILCFEMEAGGLMDSFPCLIVRGICDYADSHKNKQWQGYAAATAAAYGKELLSVVPAYQNHATTMVANCMKTITEKSKDVVAVSDTRPNPSSFLPFRRDPDFVDRPVLSQILQRASKPGALIGLVGLGGVGKSQLAIEYAYRVRDADPGTWVFWVHASTPTRFEESYRKIATHLRLPGWNEPKADVLGMVHGWLSDESNGRWTMIVDNADDADIMFERWNGGTNTDIAVVSADRSLSEFLPLSPNGSIVVTSRNQEVVKRLQVYDEDILDVGQMEVDVAKDLLIKKMKKGGRGSSTDELVHLVTHLDRMPLAISQAAAYIDQCTPRMTVSGYIKILEKSDKECMALLQKDIYDSRRDRQASNSIIMTWHMMFTRLRQIRDSAARLLALMSLFDREAIPEHLLRGRYLQAPESETDFEDDIAMLRAYGLIGIGVSEHQFNMHRLVQLSTQKWLEMHTALIEWQERYIQILHAAFPTGDYNNWMICQALFPHVEAMEKYRVISENHRQLWASVLYNGAWYAMDRGHNGVADKMVRASFEVRKDSFGFNNPVTLDSADLLAVLLRHQGKYRQAEEINRQALEGYENMLGVDHPHTLISLTGLAKVLRDQEKYSEAEELLRRVLAGEERVLGVNDPQTWTSVVNLARVLQNQGKFSEAEGMYRRVMAEEMKLLGVNHPDTWTTLINLAAVLRDQGKYSEAEEMQRQALAGYQRLLGLDHPYTLRSMKQLAYVLQNQGKYSEAEEMHRRALAGSEKVLGVEHPDTLISVGNLAGLLSAVQHYDEALNLYERAVSGCHKVLGPEHPITKTYRRHQASLVEKIRNI